jgi:hypothetical protein
VLKASYKMDGCSLRFQALTAMSMKMTALCDIAPWSGNCYVVIVCGIICA